MRAIAVLVALAAGAIAAVIPRDATEGVYVVSRDESGNEIHTRIAEPITSASEVRSILDGNGELYGRDDWLANENTHEYKTWCGCGFTMSKGDTDAAVAALKAQAGSGFTYPHLSIYSIRGNVVAFACKSDGVSKGWTSSSNIGNLVKKVTDNCGKYVPGSAHQEQSNDGSSTSDIGYMRWYSGLDFCGKARGAGTGSC
ncbi:Indoleamine 2,3-dioxygenase [Purpureocillium lavendulum]|uniref:Indoleamine 2,3-dioxygenase n=1 Tax=Purpureocillium lavendulum TaxID=1247861 RepID=A0AB34FW83_9HYPO|nr:Indoleamine 2,3-dioxygenase [Purpureocillium lavendulum]